MPAPFYYKGEAEQLCITIACASYNNGIINGIGRDGGATFQKFMDKAKQVKPKFIFIHSWNEWNAADQNQNGGGYFIDQYIDEYSSDIEPMWGRHGFKYYDLMRKNLADYKGFAYCDQIVSDKIFTFIAKQSRKVLTSNEEKIIQSQKLDNNPAQQWQVKKIGDNFYTLRNSKNNKYLSEQTDGIFIETTDNTRENQLWKFAASPEGYYQIINKKSNRFLIIEASSLKNNANVICSEEKITSDNIL